MNGLFIMIIAIVVLLAAYLIYGRYLARTWGIDPKAKTPAYELEDGVDYVPADTNVVFGHQFASIAGAAAINGPIQASVFGWIPVLLWILLGGVFFGAVQDFAAMYASVKNKGRTIGYIIESYIGKTGKKLFLLFCWLFSILVVAAFVDIVAGTFNGFQAGSDGVITPIRANGSVATTSMIFIVEAVALGFLLRYGKLHKWGNTAVAIVMLVAAVILGLRLPLYISLNNWHLLVFVYVLIASVAPIWALLQPRDYLNSYLLIAMIVAAVIGVFAARPEVNLPAFSGFTVNGQTLFPLPLRHHRLRRRVRFPLAGVLRHRLQADQKREKHAPRLLWRHADGVHAGGDRPDRRGLLLLFGGDRRAGLHHPLPDLCRRGSQISWRS